MAGVPGAGKTEFVDNLKKGPYFTNFVTIEHDKLLEYLPNYRPENYYQYRKAGIPIVNRVFRRCLEHGHSFILDGTLAHNAGLDNIKRSLKNGYFVVVVYIVLDVEKAWDVTQKREKVTKRGVDRASFVDTCNVINQRLLDIFNAYESNANFRFVYVDKKDNIAPSPSHEILKSQDSKQATEIRNRLEINYDIS